MTEIQPITPIQKLEKDLMSMNDFPEKEYLMRRVSQFLELEQLLLMKAYSDGILALRNSIVTDEVYDSYLEYYNKNYNKCLQTDL